VPPSKHFKQKQKNVFNV